MQMIKAVIRPEAADAIANGLDEAGYSSLTKINAFGRGKQKGITIGEKHYDELPKTVLLIVVEDEEVDEVIKVIRYKAYTGHIGDGKIFVSPVERVFTIRTSEEVL
ncbi:MAG: P-II family nitrogen regulator [Lachnospiraceae bacterium]